jgi:hydrogenase maturation protease
MARCRTDPAADPGAARPVPRTLVAGVGNMFLRDDGFGPEVARRLAAEPAGIHAQGSDVRVVDYGIRGMHLAYDLLEPVELLLLVDTVPADGAAPAAPGTLRILQVRSGDLDPDASLDPHGMDPAAVLGRLRSLGGDLPRTYVVGCVPADLAEGIGLSPAVAAAVPQAVAAVRQLLAGQAAGG